VHFDYSINQINQNKNLLLRLLQEERKAITAAMHALRSTETD
jgi:hypothetical protein